MKESMYEGWGRSILRAGDHEDHPKSGVEGNGRKSLTSVVELVI
jgi:hypothetical protein